MANTVDLSKLRTELEMDTTKFDQGTAKAQKDLKTLDSSFQKTQTQIKNSLTSIDKHTVASTKSMTSSIKTLREHTEKEFVKTRKAIDSLGTSVTKVNNSTKSITNAVKKLTTVSTEIKNGVKGVTESVKSNTKAVADMEKSVVKSVDNISKSIKNLNTVNEDKLANSLKKAFTNTKGDVLASTEALRQFRKELALAQREANRENIKRHTYTSYKTLSLNNSKLPSEVQMPSYQGTSIFKNVNGELNKANSSASALFGTSNSLLKTFQEISFNIFLVRQGLMQITSILDSIISPALNFSMEMETNQVGMAGILSSMTEINGKALEWNDAMGISKSIISDLNKEAVKTAATSEELITTFRALLGPGLGAGMNIDQIKEFTVVGVNAVKSLGLDGRQLVQELRDLVQGGIQPASSTLATALGLKDSDIKAAKNSAEGLFTFLMKRMEGFKYASLATGNTMKGMIDQVKEGYTLISAQGFQPLIQEMKNTLGEVRDMILKPDMSGFNDELVKTFVNIGVHAANFFNELKKIFNFIVSAGKPAFTLLGNALAFLADNFSTVVGLLSIWGVGKAVSNMYGLTNATMQATTAQQGLSGALQKVSNTIHKNSNNIKQRIQEELFLADNSYKIIVDNYKKESIAFANKENMIRAQAALSMKALRTKESWPELSEKYTELAKTLPIISKEYQKLGMSAESADRLQLKFTDLVLKGKVSLAERLLQETDLHLKNAEALKLVEKRWMSLEIAASSLTALGFALQSLNSLSGEANSEFGKLVNTFSMQLITIGMSIGAYTQLATAYETATLAGASFGTVIAGMAAPILGIGVLVGGLTAKFYQLAMGISTAEAMSRYFDSKQERERKSIARDTDNRRALKGDSVLSEEELSKLRLEREMDNSYKKIMEKLSKRDFGSTGNADTKGASRRAKGAYKALESAYKQLENLAKKQQDKLDIYYNNDLVSTQDYIDNKYTLQKLLLESEIKNLEERKKVAERLGQESDVENFNSKIETAKDNLAGLGEKSRLESIEEYKKLEDRLDSVKSKYEELFGVTQKGFEYNLAKEFSKDITRVNAEIETALDRLKSAEERNNETEKKIWSERLARLKETQKQQKEIIALKGIEREAELAKAEIQKIDLDVQAKFIEKQDQVNRLAQTQAELDGDLFLFRKEHMDEYIDQYTTLIAKYETMARMAKDTATQNKYKQMALEAREAMYQLADAVPPFQKAMKEQFIGSLSDAFQSMLWQEKTAKEALEDFAKSILQTWSKKVFDEVATAMTDGLFQGLLPKGEKTANVKLKTEEIIQAKVQVNMEDFKNKIINSATDIQQSLTNNLIPSVNTTAQSMQNLATHINNLVGVPNGMPQPTENVPNLNVPNLLAEKTSYGDVSNNYAYSFDGTTSSLKDFKSYTDKLSNSTAGLTTEFTDVTQSMKLGKLATDATTESSKQAGEFAIPMMITSLLSASGSLGKFGVVLQGVMMAMQIGKMAGLWKFADGGYVSGAGTATSDSIPARLSNGEYVLKASSVKALGTDFLDTLNNVGGYTRSSKLPKFAFADGGYVNAPQNAPQEGLENIPKTIQSSPQVVMNMTFQSLDPESNMKMMEAQYPSIRNRLIRDLQSNASMRTAVKGASK